MPEKTQKRVFELDFLRGLAIIMMILHHFIYDLRFIFDLDVFAFQNSNFFVYWIRPPFVFIFLFVSGISSTFSKNNMRRAIKLTLVAILFSAVFYVVSKFSGENMYVIFNVIHLLALGSFIYSLFSFLKQKKILKSVEKYYLSISVIILWLYVPLSKLDSTKNILLSPIHDAFSRGIGMADYMPIVPWLGFFFFGTFWGTVYYKNKTTCFPNVSRNVLKITSPFEFVGRNALIFYIFHQPVLLGTLYLLRVVGLI